MALTHPAGGTGEPDPAAAALRLLCLVASPMPATPAVLAEAAAAVRDWPALLGLAAGNGLLPLLHRRLAEVAGVPDAPRAALRDAYAANARDALRLSGELRHLMDALGARGVRAAAYKGPALAVRAYGDVALRRYADLDVLVDPPAIPAAAAVLEARGYRPYHRFTPAREAHFRRVDGDYPFSHPHTGARVELHARVSSLRFPPRLPTEALLARARPVPVGGGTVPALADEDLLLALCVHGAKHRWSRLEWLASFAALVRAAGADPAELAARGAEAGAGRMALLALGLAHDLLALPLPPETLAAYRADAGLATLAAESAAAMAARGAAEEGAPADTDDPAATAAMLRYAFRVCDDAADRARLAARWLFTPSPEDWNWLSVPDPFTAAYRVLRPLRLTLRYGARRRR